MASVSIQTRVPKKMKEEASKILESIGLDFSTANRMFYAQIIEKKGIPFDIITTKYDKPIDEVELTEEEEREWNRQMAEKSLASLWNNPEDEEWDEILKDLPPIKKT